MHIKKTILATKQSKLIENSKAFVALQKSFGIFKHRVDMEDSEQWVRDQRKPRSS